MSDINKQTRHQSISINLKLNDNNNTSLQQEDFLCFGDFTKEELNIYLNKTTNSVKKKTSRVSDDLTPELEIDKEDKVSTTCAAKIPWQCLNNNKQENNPNSAHFTTKTSNKLADIEIKLLANKRKESVSYNSSKSSSYSPPPTSHLITNNFSESNESLTSESSVQVTRMPSDTQNDVSISTSNDAASAAAANESAQQRRNKKRKPPNYYQSAEYAAILKTTDESSTTSTASTTLVNNVNTTSNTCKIEKNNHEPLNSTLNHKFEISTDAINVNCPSPPPTPPSPPPPPPPTTTTASLQSLDDNNQKQLTNNQSNVQSENTNIESNIEKEIKNLNLENIETNENISTVIETISNRATQSIVNNNSHNNKSIPVTNSSSKCWSSLFKSSAAPTLTTVTTTTVTSTTTSTNSSQNKQNKNSKIALASSMSLPISASSSSVSSSSSSSSNHVHLNGTTPTTSINNNHSATNNNSVSSEQSSFDVLRLLGTMFKQCELKHSAPALQPRGIRNKQNWCYVNATLQALLACPPFYNLIKSIFMKIKSSNTNIKNVPCIAALGRFISEFKTMVRVQPQHDNQSKQSNNFSFKELVIGESFEIDYFYETLANLKAELTFKTGRQEDAQEFLSFLLNRLHDEMVKCLESLNQNENNDMNDHSKTNGSGLNNHSNNHEDQIQEEEDEWKEVGKKNRSFVTRKTEFKQSPLSDIFCGQFRSALSQPGVKDKESVSLEPFFTIPLDIQPDSVRNVQQALEHFVQKEEVYGYTNQETKQEIEAFKRISFEDLPPVLILYLKCFIYDKQGGIQKLLKRIDFQIDLEINKELISPNQRSKLREKKRNYKLFAVEYHQGDKANGGHYITDVYHPGIIGWVRYDDANVKVINNAQVLKSEDKKLIPYLLYYRRADLI